MTFEQADPIIQRWAKENRLHVATRYKESNVRSVQIVGHDGKRCQIWFRAGDRASVCVWDYRRRSEELPADSENLGDQLERALYIARTWVGL